MARSTLRLIPVLAAVCATLVAALPAFAQGNNCLGDVTSIRRAEAQLPKLEVAPPGDRQIVCITLETNILFARRLAAHLKSCPRSPLAGEGDGWQQTGAQYTAQFNERHCKPAIRGYRG